ncbi:focadhesin-like [Procambarus clarkii]|uniref:focadhesin n=1 Tax=Procambarus clarkii TaxID=6728 RepID=UPI001E676DA2|nr:focadhesin-like [Procambarus clarkii]XP_045617467.1 focadhesin-like [Procambarus clarkii]
MGLIMDEYEQKINSGNVFLQSQAITKLHTKMVENNKDGTSLYESDEVKLLWQTVNKGDITEATLAVETLVALIKSGLLPMPAVLQNFLADVTCAKSPSALVQGITAILLMSQIEKDGQIQCPFTGPPTGPTHPFVTLIIKRVDLIPTVLEEVASILRHPEQRVRTSSIYHIRPLLLHTFCLTEKTLGLARPLLSLIVSSHITHAELNIIPLLCRIAPLIKDSSRDHVERKVMVLTALAEIAVGSSLTRLQSALLPCLVMAVPLAMKQGLGTRTLERYMNTIASRLGRGCDITICALAEILPQTCGQLQVNLLKLGATLLSYKDGNPLVGARLLPSLLQVLSAPCTSVPGLTTAAAALVSLVQATPAQASSNTQLAGNEYWETLCCTFSSLVSYIPALEFSDRLVRDPKLASDWLTKLASSINQISSFYHTIVTSVFLYQGSTTQSVQQATKVLEREVMKKKALSLEVFPMVLYRLGRETDPTTRLTILYTLPSLAVNKLCVALVLKTLLALWSSGSLRPLVLRLVYDLWTVEPRTYSYLSQLIHDKSINTNEIQIARAFVVSSVCKAKPSQHGEELLPLLSGFLNECRDEDGTAQTLIALDGIYDLCANQIIDLRTTWRVIAPKLVRDKRPGVTEKLCTLLGLVPVLHVASTEYDKFTTDALTILWNWVASHRSLPVVKAAYMALEKFKYDNYTLKMLPQYARHGHQLPASMAATPFEAARKPEDVLNYVPGLGWVKLIKGCPESHLEYVASFINSLVSREVAALPKGIYLTAVQEAKRRGIKGSGGQPEPQSYSFFKDSSILKALVSFLLEFPKMMENCECEQVKQRLLRSSVLMLEALGQSLSRPYPALDWCFLEKVLTVAQSTCNYDWITRIRHSLFKIAGRQCNKSTSASALISKWLVPAPSNGLTREDEIVLYQLLDHLGRGLPPTVLQPFLSYVFNQHLSDTVHMKALLEALKPNLTADFIFDTNRNVLSNAIENLNEHIDPSNEVLYVSYKACVADLPQKHIERLTSPSLWWEVTDERLYRAAVLRCHVAEKDPEELALPWLNDLVDSAASLPGDRSHLLRVMSNTLIVRCRVKESSAWFLQLLGRLRDHLKKKPGDNLVAVHEQQQRVTFYLDLVVMGLLVWSDLWATNQMEVLAETPALRDRLLLPSLVTLSGQSEWKQTLNQLLNWLVSCHSLMGEHVNSRYHLSSPTLLLATLNPNLTQIMWNKVIALLI